MDTQDNDEQAPGPGTVVENRYRLGERLGVGGMGSVFRARHLLLDQDVALKVVPVPPGEDTLNPAHAFCEARALARMKHPNIVQMYDCGRLTERYLFLAMELLDGRDLRCELKQRRALPWACAKGIAFQVASALQSCHAQGVIHRDLKPANVFLTGPLERAHVKLIDFGAALLESSESAVHPPQTGRIVCTPAFVAPEQVLRKPLDHRVDIYGFGCLLFTMAAGRLPFLGRDPISLANQNLLSPVPRIELVTPHSDAPAGLQALVERCMAKKTSERPSSIDEVVAELLTLDAGELALHPPAHPPRPARERPSGGPPPLPPSGSPRPGLTARGQAPAPSRNARPPRAPTEELPLVRGVLLPEVPHLPPSSCRLRPRSGRATSRRRSRGCRAPSSHFTSPPDT